MIMEVNRYNRRQLITDQDSENSTESGPDSPASSSMFSDVKMASISSLSSPKRSKRGIHKRVISVPIKDVEGRLKGESAPPPADSWAWRKYGQKPIKGSPYPRGYYRCSSSKGCPARKQVERSRVDPSMLVVTYSCEHNHQFPPPSKNHHHHSSIRHSSKQEFIPLTPTKEPEPEPEPEPEQLEAEPEPEQLEAEPEADQSEEKFTDLGDESLITTDEFSWFGEMETTSSTILESPIFADINKEIEAFYPMREEDASLFADLGELPECSTVFRHHRGVGPQAQIC